MNKGLPGLRPTTEPSDEVSGVLRTAGENELADKIRGALGAAPFEEISVVSPPHKSRGDGMEVTYMPLTVEDFDALRTLSIQELKRIGMRKWDESGLMLFPCEWFPLIPVGFEVTDIFGETETWDPSAMDDDGRFGVLAYGFIPEPNP